MASVQSFVALAKVCPFGVGKSVITGLHTKTNQHFPHLKITTILIEMTITEHLGKNFVSNVLPQNITGKLKMS